MYDFAATLPQGYMDDLRERAQEDQPKLSRVELRRRTQAEELLSALPDFPVDICVIALERCNDDMTLAANWLIENG